MPIIEWTREFSVGNSRLDEQHKQWLAIYNEAHDRMMAPGETDFQSTGLDALREMEAYGLYHFACEEAYMAEVGYPDMEVHKGMHALFAIKIKEQIRDLEAGRHVLNSEVIKFIENWLSHHILEEDQKFRIHADQGS